MHVLSPSKCKSLTFQMHFRCNIKTLKHLNAITYCNNNISNNNNKHRISKNYKQPVSQFYQHLFTNANSNEMFAFILVFSWDLKLFFIYVAVQVIVDHEWKTKEICCIGNQLPEMPFCTENTLHFVINFSVNMPRGALSSLSFTLYYL